MTECQHDIRERKNNVAIVAVEPRLPLAKPQQHCRVLLALLFRVGSPQSSESAPGTPPRLRAIRDHHRAPHSPLAPSVAMSPFAVRAGHGVGADAGPVGLARLCALARDTEDSDRAVVSPDIDAAVEDSGRCELAANADRPAAPQREHTLGGVGVVGA